MSGHTVLGSAGAAMKDAQALPSVTLRSSVEALASLPTVITRKIQGFGVERATEAFGSQTVLGVRHIDSQLNRVLICTQSLISKLTPWNIAAGFLAILAVRVVAALIYRLYFHPLANVPGPRIAAMTRGYEFYYQALQHTKFPQKVKELHKQYGPIVRISPEEVSLNDSEFNVDFFMHDKKLKKEPWYYFFGFQDALFVLQDREKHRRRQAQLAAHFKGPHFTATYPMITREIAAMIGKFEHAAENKETLNLSQIYRKTGNDVMRNSLLGDNYDGENADSSDFSPKAEVKYQPLFRSAAFVRHFPWMMKIHNVMPNWVLKLTVPLAFYKREIESMIRGLIKSHDENGKPAHNKSLFYQIIDHDESYREENSKSAIEEFMELLWGGREVLGHSLSNVSYHLMCNPQRMARLHAELKTATFDLTKAGVAQLQTLPYLWACCKEGIRLQRGGNFRIPRVCTEDVQYKQYFLPAGTPISMSPNFFHCDENIFPDAESFVPERWLSGDVERLEKHWHPFGNGSRSCGGRPMAFEIIFRGVANIFSQYKIDFEGCDAEYCMKEGMMEVFPQESSTGLRVSVRRWED